jgi:hypothetical protein
MYEVQSTKYGAYNHEIRTERKINLSLAYQRSSALPIFFETWEILLPQDGCVISFFRFTLDNPTTISRRQLQSLQPLTSSPF